MTLKPPFDAGAKNIMKRWLEQQTQPEPGDQLLQIAAWLDGRLSARESAQVELLLASDPQWLQAALTLRASTPVPVPTAELLCAQNLISTSTRSSIATQRPQRAPQWVTTLWSAWQNWQPVPIAAGAMLSALIMAGGIWLGTAASQDFGLEDLQTTSQFEITQLDFSGINVNSKNIVDGSAE